MIDHTKLGKGALPDPPDERDYKAEPILGASAPVNWTQEFRLPDPGNEDQGTSNSCVAQAFSYYHSQLHVANYSRRDLYSRIVQPGGGAYLRDGADAIVKQGQATRDEVPDPTPETEAGMTAGAGTATQEAAHEELNYFNIASKSIDAVAQAIRDYKGVVFGVYGSNEGWFIAGADPSSPKPPKDGDTLWGHALYGMGYHTHDDGQKCIIAKSSWCGSGVLEHHIKANYFSAQLNINGTLVSAIMNPWTLIPKAQQTINNNNMTAFKKQNDPTEYVLVGSVLVPIADPTAATTLGVNSVVELTDAQFGQFIVGSGTLFKSA